MKRYDRGTRIRILIENTFNDKTYTYIGDYESEDEIFLNITDRKLGYLSIRKTDIKLISTKDQKGDVLQ